MTTADQFKIIREMQITQSSEGGQVKQEQQSKFGKLVHCHFSNIKEQTQNDVEKPFKGISEFQILKRDQRCYYQDTSLRIYSRGGSEFIVPMHFQVENVFPIENGIIVQVRYDKDLLFFDPLQIRKEQHKPKPQEYAYMTITDHPLDDIHPLSLGGKQDLISTSMQILHVNYKIPFIVLYNPHRQEVTFGLLKQSQENFFMKDFNNDDNDNYIKSIEPESRHPDLYNIAKQHMLFIQELYTFAAQEAPTKLFLSKGLINPFELVVTLHYSQQQKAEIYSCDMRQPKEFRKTQVIPNIQDITQLQFSRQKYDSDQEIKVIPKTKANMIAQSDARQSVNLDLKMLKKRIKYFTKDTLMTDTQGRVINIYQGASLIFSFDFITYMESQLDKSLYSKISRIESFEQPSKSNITVNFSNGISKRISMRLQISDFLVKSIMKSMKIILPQALYETLNQDLIELLARCNLEPHKFVQSNTCQDQFTKFSNLLLGILTGDQQYFMKQAQLQSPVQQPNIQPQAKPTQTLQTKILRSSTTSFGTDSMASRRKTLNTPASQGINTSQRIQQQQIRSSVIGQGQTQQRRIATSGGAEPVGVSMNPGQPSQLQISNNPFADLLNSEFHKDNFKTTFAQFFPADMKLTAPVPIQQVQEQVPSVQVSPTKQATKPAQRISSTRQSNVLQATHERKNSNATSQLVQQPQSQMAYPYKVQRQDLLPHFGNIFIILHLLFEDLKLNKLRDSIEGPKLARFLCKLALEQEPYQKAAFVDYYLKEYPTLKDEVNPDIKRIFKDGQLIRDDVDIQPVPKIFKWLEGSLKNQQFNGLNYPFPLFFEKSRKVVRIYEILNNQQSNSHIQPLISQNIVQKAIDYSILEGCIFNQSSIPRNDMDQRDYLKQDRHHDSSKNLHLFEKILFTLKEENLNLDELKKLPSIVSLPILEIIRYTRLFQQEVQTLPIWPDSLYKLIQREDILNNLRLFQRGKDNKLKGTTGDTLELAFNRQQSKRYALTRGLTNVFQGNTIEELQQEDFRKEMETNIIKTAAHLINDQSKITGGAEKKNSQMMDFLKNRFANDTRFKEVQNMLNSNNEIIIKLEHIPNRESLAEDAMNTEKQKLLDKMFHRHLSKSVGRGAMTFGTVQNLPTETLNIPKINQTGYVPMNETYMQVEFKDEQSKDILQWPEFHNGVAAALRIAQSFNKNHSKSDIHQASHTRNWIMYHKPPEPRYEHGGFLLAIGLLGQFDTLQPTDIYQHLKSTHDATTIGILLGRAASKIGTMDDHDTRTLCIHIPYLLPPTLSIDISLSIQSAAVIGAGLLYKSTSNRLMTEMLLAQIGRKPLSDKAIEREGYALASGIALGLVNLGIGTKMQGLTDLKLDERLIRYVEGGKIIDLPQSMLSQNFNHENTKCSSIKEGDMVNVHITSQGALIALALIHLKSNNRQLTNQLVMPQTFYSLESVRPSFLLLKVLCKNLIMWDDIKSSKKWVQSQIPDIIRDIYENDIATVDKMFNQKLIEDGIDYSTVALCYVNIIAGAIFSIGFKYAGTGNRKAFAKVHHYYNMFRKLKIMQANKDQIGLIHTNFTKNQVDKNTVETCLCVSAFAMSMIMAGTGDIECFKALRVLRKRFEHDMHYGYNMAIHMSFGFLFLGSGAFTLSRNDLAIAALLCSLYPVFPSTPGDNRYHLQALRHFYVLAIESRLLQARDIDTGEFLNIEMNVHVEDNSGSTTKNCHTMKIQTPDIINGKVKSIEIKNQKYHSVNLAFANEDEDMEDEQANLMDKKQKIFEQFDFQKIVYVKKKASSQINDEAHSSKDAISTFKSIHPLLAENLVKLEINSRELIEEGAKIYEKIIQIRDPTIEAFYKNFTNLDDCAHISTMSDVEDVLLAQNRDPFSQLSPTEYFKIQDLFDQLKDSLLTTQIPLNIKHKLLLLNALHDTYYQDKLELIINHLDYSLPKQQTYRNYNVTSLLSSYIHYRSAQPQLSKLPVDNQFIQEPQALQTKLALQHFKKQLTNYQSFDYIAADLHSIDLHEIQVAKVIVETLLSNLRQMGEGDKVKKYMFNKINGVEVEESYFVEINKILTMSLQQVITGSGQFVEHVVLPGLLEIERSE